MWNNSAISVPKMISVAEICRHPSDKGREDRELMNVIDEVV